MKVAPADFENRQREEDEFQLQKQLGGAIREALRPTLTDPLPFELRLLLDILASRQKNSEPAA